MDSEFGKCEICKKDANLTRKYFRYAIICACHSPQHFEIVRHCKDCIPVEPKETKLILKTSLLDKFISQEVIEAMDYCRRCERDLGFMGSSEYNKQKQIIENYNKRQEND